MTDYTSFEQAAGAQNWDVKLNAFCAALNTDIAALYLFVNSTAATSESSLLVATGSKAFTIDQAGFTATAGATYKATSTGAPTAVMVGTVVSFTGGVLTLTVTNVGGSGTHADWQITPVLASASAQAEVDVASATTTDLGAAASDNVRITGTTTITGLGTALAGIRRYVRFQGALSLTYDATTLILKGAATRTTAANDSSLFVSLGSGNWIELIANRADGTSITATPVLPVTERTSNTIIASADKGKSFKITSGTFTQTWDTGANLGASFSCLYENAGTGIVTTVTDGTTWALYPGEARQFYSDGSNVKSICIRAGTLVDTTSGNFIVAPGWKGWDQDLLGAGGGGGGGIKAAASSGNGHSGGAGGGGGTRKIRRILLSDTSLAAGATVAYTIGAAGTAGTAGTSPTAGGNGGNTTFNGDTAYGGGGGDPGATAAANLGGAGAGMASAAAGSGTSGTPAATAGTAGIAGQGVKATGTGGVGAEWGGAAGGGGASGGGTSAAGSSMYGGAAGGAGGGADSSDVLQAASAGGTQGSTALGGGGAAATGTAGNAGSPGSYGANGLGQGGGGGAPNNGSGAAGAGGAGSPGCGGGGGGAMIGTGTAGAGGLGGSGKITIKGF
jgi:hypothetical protein